MNGHATGHDSCNACWCDYNELLVGQFLNILQECRLASTSTSSKEEALVGVLHKLESLFLADIGFVQLGCLWRLWVVVDDILSHDSGIVC